MMCNDKPGQQQQLKIRKIVEWSATEIKHMIEQKHGIKFKVGDTYFKLTKAGVKGEIE